MKHTLSLLALLLLTSSLNAQTLSRFEKMFTTPSDWNTTETPDSTDIIFNELMPFVTDGNSKFIELYNNSTKTVDLSLLRLANWTEDGSFNHIKTITDTELLFIPGQYAVIAADTDLVNCPAGSNDEALYVQCSLPLFSSTTTSLALITADSTVIDKLFYSLSWHSPAIEDRHNVSLERINPHGITQDSLNWHSAASTVGYNTAGWKNSQSITESDTEKSSYFWFVNGSTFTPNNDGIGDFLQLGYSLPAAGYSATVRIYTRGGTLIATAYQNWLLSQQGSLIYDGSQGDATIQTGIYIMHITATHPSHPTIRQKLAFVKGS